MNDFLSDWCWCHFILLQWLTAGGEVLPPGGGCWTCFDLNWTEVIPKSLVKRADHVTPVTWDVSNIPSMHWANRLMESRYVDPFCSRLFFQCFYTVRRSHVAVMTVTEPWSETSCENEKAHFWFIFCKLSSAVNNLFYLNVKLTN